MNATIVKWGNSQGIRLPKALLESVNLSENDVVEVSIIDKTIVIRKAETKKKYKTIQERFEGFNDAYTFEEWNTGEPIGKEIW